MTKDLALTNNSAFNKWWTENKTNSEFAGVSMAAAVAIWNASHGDKAEIIKDEPDPLPPAFMKVWAQKSQTSEFAGCSMPAAYAIWLAAEQYFKGNSLPGIDGPTPRRVKKAPITVVEGDFVEPTLP